MTFCGGGQGARTLHEISSWITHSFLKALSSSAFLASHRQRTCVFISFLEKQDCHCWALPAYTSTTVLFREMTVIPHRGKKLVWGPAKKGIRTQRRCLFCVPRTLINAMIQALLKPILYPNRNCSSLELPECLTFQICLEISDIS